MTVFTLIQSAATLATEVSLTTTSQIGECNVLCLCREKMGGVTAMEGAEQSVWLPRECIC